MFGNHVYRQGITLALLLGMSFIAACTSTSVRQYQLSESSFKQGQYAAAFDHAVQSLQADIHNSQSQLILPEATRAALDHGLMQADQFKRQQQWDQMVREYEQIERMGVQLQAIQHALNLEQQQKRMIPEKELQRIDAIQRLAIPSVNLELDQARGEAAEAHYRQGQQWATAGRYRDAVAAFKRAREYRPGYRDTLTLEARYQRKADLADAQRYYHQGEQAAAGKHYRQAAEAFQTVLSYVPDYRDAATLSVRYKSLADQQDAQRNYQLGLAEARQGHYRDAANAFAQANQFVSGYLDAANLYQHYTRLADEQDAALYYNDGLRYFDQDEFKEAAAAFRKSDEFVPGFRNAREMAEEAEYAIAPRDYRVINMIKKEINEHGAGHRWFKEHSRSRFISMQVDHIRILNVGRYDRLRHEWPYRMHLELSGVVENRAGQHERVSSEVNETFYLYRDRKGRWEIDYSYRK